MLLLRLILLLLGGLLFDAVAALAAAKDVSSVCLQLMFQVHTTMHEYSRVEALVPPLGRILLLLLLQRLLLLLLQ